MNQEMRSLWGYFLPRKAIVMARHLKHQILPKTVDVPPQSLPVSIPEATPQTELQTSQAKLLKISADLQGCMRCKLCHGRKSIVVGEGNSHASVVFVGEGPGEQEDLQGRPFVGKAGQLLDRMIEAICLDRSQVYIANVVKCRPPGNRNPEYDEIQACNPFLHQQIDAIRPKVIVALGKFAAQTLLGTEEKISSLRGQFHSYRGAKLMPTFHPAYLLRNPSSKREAWIDLQKVAHELGIQIPKRTTNVRIVS